VAQSKTEFEPLRRGQITFLYTQSDQKRACMVTVKRLSGDLASSEPPTGEVLGQRGHIAAVIA
jgi:hypothetical protein